MLGAPVAAADRRQYAVGRRRSPDLIGRGMAARWPLLALALALLARHACARPPLWPFGRDQDQGAPGKQALATPDSSPQPWVEQLSWSPRAYLYHGFLSDAECDHIVNLARPMMRRSTVVGQNGKSVLDNIRTSFGTFLRRRQDDVIRGIEDRLAMWTKLPTEHQEDMQILRYAIGQKYGAHYDSLENDSPRIATVLLYLRATDLEGGETAFPNESEWLAEPQNRASFSPCAEGHVAAKPKKGDALLFYSLRPGGQSDRASLHTGCPVLAGTKWTATKWIHTLPFHPEWLQNPAPNATLLPEDCQDAHPTCARWAADGECDKNPDYMRGDGGMGLGACRAACGNCEPCGAADAACRARNRERAGFLPLSEAD